MPTVERFEDLQAWKHARALVRRTYQVTRGGSFSQDLGFRDQLRRSSVSVMANIAEGFESRAIGLFLESLGRARGSAGEVRAQLYAALDAGLLNAIEFDELSEMAAETSKRISGLMRYLDANGSAYRTRQRIDPPSTGRDAPGASQ